MNRKSWSLMWVIAVASLLCPENSASAAEPITPANLGKTIVNWATGFVNKRAIGNDRQCTELVAAALGVTGCKPASKDSDGKYLVWGRALKSGEKMQMGDIIQFKSFVIKDVVTDGNVTWNFTWNLGAPDHTAIFIEEKDGKVYVVHQNVDGDVKKSVVRIQGFDFAKKVKGSYIVYRPELK